MLLITVLALGPPLNRGCGTNWRKLAHILPSTLMSRNIRHLFRDSDFDLRAVVAVVLAVKSR